MIKPLIITYGGLTELIIEYVFEYYLETEIPIKIISLAKLNPINFKNIKNSLKNNKVLVLRSLMANTDLVQK